MIKPLGTTLQTYPASASNCPPSSDRGHLCLADVLEPSLNHLTPITRLALRGLCRETRAALPAPDSASFLFGPGWRCLPDNFVRPQPQEKVSTAQTWRVIKAIVQMGPPKDGWRKYEVPMQLYDRNRAGLRDYIIRPEEWYNTESFATHLMYAETSSNAELTTTDVSIWRRQFWAGTARLTIHGCPWAYCLADLDKVSVLAVKCQDELSV